MSTHGSADSCTTSHALEQREAPPIEWVYVGPEFLVGKNAKKTSLPRKIVQEYIPTAMVRMNQYEVLVHKDDNIVMFHGSHMFPQSAHRPRGIFIFFSDKLYAKLQREIDIVEPDPRLLCEVETGKIFGFPHGFVVY